MRCTVLGAGSWGTALASLLASKGFTVTAWDKDGPVLAARQRMPGRSFCVDSVCTECTVRGRLRRSAIRPVEFG